MISSAALFAMIEKAVASRVQQQLQSLRVPSPSQEALLNPSQVEKEELRRNFNGPLQPVAAASPCTPQFLKPSQAEEEEFRRSVSMASTSSADTIAPHGIPNIIRRLSATSSSSASAGLHETLDTEHFASCYNDIVPIFRFSKKKLYKECFTSSSSAP